jgi:1-acyl-sn-glycerol-3-phosphate acyltransferase
MVALSRRSSESTRRWPRRRLPGGRPQPRQASRTWRALTLLDATIVAMVGRIEITGSIPKELRDRPMLITANHIGVFDPFVIMAALRKAGVNPRFLLAGGLLDTPILGWALRQGGSVRVDRRSTNVAESFEKITDALRETPGPVLVYPEGRISLTPGLWPERGKTGAARIALAGKLPVLTISQWGAHEAVYWGTEVVNGWRDVMPLVTSFLRAVRTRPVFQVHFGELVDLSDLSPEKPGDAVRAHKRIMQAITDGLVPLRPDEPDVPAFHDPTRPTTSKSPWRS